MLAESDPRRANWLTISTSEDLCWPEENGTSRPSWELEAEILRLTTRLMMQERELRQVKAQLKSQARLGEQQIATWRRKMTEMEDQMQLLLVQKDSEMQAIVSQLMLFEAELKQEQNRIEGLLKGKDSTIYKQQEEIKRLQSLVNTSDRDRADNSSEVRNGSVKTTEKSSSNPANGFPEKEVVSSSPVVFADPSPNNASLERRSSFPTSTGRVDPKGACTSVMTITAESRVPYLLYSGQSDFRIAPTDSRLYSPHSTDAAVKKIKDSFIRFRGIQDLTNVRSRCEKALIPDTRSDNFVVEKRRIPHKTPQKMKDLKAKRINMQHRNHRPDFCGQVIL